MRREATDLGKIFTKGTSDQVLQPKIYLKGILKTQQKENKQHDQKMVKRSERIR